MSAALIARARAWCQVLFVLSLAATVVLWVPPLRGTVFPGDPRDNDFLSFWTAAQLALGGHPEAAYVPELLARVQTDLLGPSKGYAAFMYPPVFLLLCVPLGLLAYGWALLAWLVLRSEERRVGKECRL